MRPGIGQAIVYARLFISDQVIIAQTVIIYML